MALAAAIGLVAAGASTWVHHQVLTDPAYASFCDVNSSLSCTNAYASRYGSVAGVPVALLGVLFFAGILLLLAWPRPIAAPAAPARQAMSSLAAIVGLGWSSSTWATPRWSC